jgi:uncharacterized membrane protein YqiK
MKALKVLYSLVPAGIAIALFVVLAPMLWKWITRKYFKASPHGAVLISGASTGIGRCVLDGVFMQSHTKTPIRIQNKSYTTEAWFEIH